MMSAAAGMGQAIQYTDIVRDNPPQHLHIARIDLTDPSVQIIVSGGPAPTGPGRWETVLRTPSETAKLLNLDLAINSVFFAHQSHDGNDHHYTAGDPARSCNLVMIDGKIVSSVQAGAALMFDAQNHPSIAAIDNARQIPASARQIVAGSLILVQDGKNIAPPPGEAAPRTVAGIAGNGRVLVLMVVDGRRPDSHAGMTLQQAGDQMVELGCSMAINLDGGGSSTMAVRDKEGRVKVVNTPSDGATLMLPLSVERPVAYTLGVRIKH